MKQPPASLGLLAMMLVALLTSTAARADASCRITNVTPMNFGQYDTSSTAPLDSFGQLAIDCAGPTPVRVLMGRGLSGRQMPRSMQSRGTDLEYNLYLDAARTIVWGDGTEGTQVFMGMIGGATLDVPIFGRVFSQQPVPRGTYTDRIIAFAVF